MAAVGSMRYSFIDKQGEKQTIDVPADVLKKGKRDGLSNRETCLLYAANNGYMVDVPATTGKKTEKKKSTRTRKEDSNKKSIIAAIEEHMLGQDFVDRVEVINPENQIQIVIDGNIYELKMVKKRNPK